MAHCSPIQNPIGLLRTVTILYTYAFVIARHSCHRCVYLMVIVIFAVVACTIKFSLKRTCFRRFSLSSGGLGHFAIMWSSDPHLRHFRGGRSKFLLDETSTAQDFSFFILILLKYFSAEWLLPLKCAVCVNRVCSLIMSTRYWDTSVKIQVISMQGRDVQWFFSVNFSSPLNSNWWISIWAEYFPPWWKLFRNVCISWSSE